MEQDTAINQTPTSEVQTTPKQSNFLVTLLSILLLTSCLIAGFFAYQTQKLVKELRVIDDETKLTPAETASPLPSPNTDQLPFTFDIPQNWTVLNPIQPWQNGVRLKSSIGTIQIIKISESPITTESLTSWYDDISTKASYNGSSTIEKREKIVIDKKIGVKLSEFFDTRHINIYIPRPSYVVQIEITPADSYNHQEVQDIIQSIKFTEPVTNTSPLPVACTMEAKICPDGSAVGRSGPKCEFAPCPTPKP